MLTRAIPCPNCGCGPSCTLVSDDFSTNTIANYTQESGSWSVTGGKLDPPATGLLKVNAADPGTGDGLSFKSTFTAGSATGVFRFIIDYVDASNYHFAEITVSTSTIATMKLGKRTSGSDSFYTTARTLSPFGWANTYTVTVCRTATFLTATFEPIAASKISAIARPASWHGGDYAAVSSSSVGSSARFDDFLIKVSGAGCESCHTYGCPSLCSEMPKSASITFAGAAMCSGIYNATWVVDWDADVGSGCSGTNPVADCNAGGGTVGWSFIPGGGGLTELFVSHGSNTGLRNEYSQMLGTSPINCAAVGTLNPTWIGIEDPASTCTIVFTP